MRKLVFTFSLAGAILVLFFIFREKFQKDEGILPKISLERPLEKYAIVNLSKATFEPGNFFISNKISDTEDYSSYLFNFQFKPDLKNLKTTSGQINIPLNGDKLPLVLMLRGYVDQKLYKTGDGTKNASAFFAKNGFITISPDFLGYGDSDTESGNIFETRFQTYVTVLSLLKTFEETSFRDVLENKWDRKNIFIWAHSNGGQIALTSLEISGKSYPTTLWAPVTKPFPYSVLYYTDQSDDGGKLIRRELAKFENDYDTDLYSLTKYMDRLQAKIQINQGASDDAVPVTWSRDFVKELKALKKDIIYNEFPGSDHNMRPDRNSAILNDLEFFRSNRVD